MQKEKRLSKSQERGVKSILLELFNHRVLYLMALPGLLLFFFINYMPMFGSIVAFKDFHFGRGILGSDWQNPIFNNFKYLFSSPETFRATKNTVLLNLLFITGGTVSSVTLAIFLNEMSHQKLKKLIQSFTFLPYFVSWIVVSVFVYGFFSSDTGILNGILTKFDMEAVFWYSQPQYWPWILLIIVIWKGIGYHSIIYLATLSGFNPALYEAADIDGASRWHKIFHITLPLLRPTVIILTLLAFGRIMNADFGMFYGIIGDNSLLFESTDVLDTFIFRNLRKVGDIGMASAANLYQSSIAFLVVIITNHLARSIDQDSALF